MKLLQVKTNCFDEIKAEAYSKDEATIEDIKKVLELFDKKIEEETSLMETSGDYDDLDYDGILYESLVEVGINFFPVSPDVVFTV